MLKKEELSAIEMITVESTNYLGIIKAGDAGIKIEKAMKITSELDESIMIDYILAENEGTLNKPLDVIGNFTAAHVALNDDQSFEFETALRKCERFAAKHAKAAENAYVKRSM